MLVVDASIAVEYLLRTPTGMAIAPLLDDADLMAPELLDAEVLAVLRREVQRGALAVDRAAEALEDLGRWSVERVAHRPLLDVAWALRDRVSAYDALYVAAAALHGATLVTADGALARAPALPVAVHVVRRPM